MTLMSSICVLKVKQNQIYYHQEKCWIIVEALDATISVLESLKMRFRFGRAFFENIKLPTQISSIVFPQPWQHPDLIFCLLPSSFNNIARTGSFQQIQPSINWVFDCTQLIMLNAIFHHPPYDCPWFSDILFLSGWGALVSFEFKAQLRCRENCSVVEALPNAHPRVPGASARRWMRVCILGWQFFLLITVLVCDILDGGKSIRWWDLVGGGTGGLRSSWRVLVLRVLVVPMPGGTLWLGWC